MRIIVSIRTTTIIIIITGITIRISLTIKITVAL
jgi:hypothetical protein